VHFSDDGDIYGAAERAGCEAGEVVDFSANVSASGASERVRDALAHSAGTLGRYPDPEARTVRKLAAARFDVGPENVLAGNGATEFIFAIPQWLRPRRVLLVAPCYHDYWRAIDHAGGEAEGVLAPEANEFVPDLQNVEGLLSGVDMMLFGNPNNPTGVAVPAESLRKLAKSAPRCIFVIDEAYAEFVPEAGGASMLGQPLPENVIVLRSLSAFHALPGLRLGFMIAHEEICRQVQASRVPRMLSSSALAVGEALLDDGAEISGMREEVIAERERVRDELSRMTGIRVFHSQANFLLAKITRPSLTSVRLCERLLSQRILIRNAAGFRGLDGKFVRISIRSKEDNARLLEAMRVALDESKWK